ncbi:serine/threonine-protein kinase BIK1-like [Lactuca sativa]|uniref:serine/threonine-protein kinase BIK1-like n=1 Tax=Lactuca sativa TaxID=4236 RepID=UPI0022AFDC94|nr:serine/threonine-protein kinase BIK1-like [Lactuca sativa]
MLNWTYTPTKKGVDAEIGSKSDFIVQHKPISIEIDATIGSDSTNKSFRTFTYTELAVASGNFTNKEYSPTLMDFIYKGWVIERTYGPTINGYGLAMYIRKMEIPTRKDIKLEHFNHPNLVKFFGYCLNDRKLFCVYEYISSITLDAYLYGGGKHACVDLTSVSPLVGLGSGGFAAAHAALKAAACKVDFNARLSDFAFVTQNFQLDAYYYASP